MDTSNRRVDNSCDWPRTWEWLDKGINHSLLGLVLPFGALWVVSAPVLSGISRRGDAGERHFLRQHRIAVLRAANRKAVWGETPL